MKSKILLISEALSAPFDEGTKNVVFELHNQFKDNINIVSLTNATNETNDLVLEKIKFNKLFLNNKLRLFLKRFSPDLILYIPETSCTFNSILRAKILKLMSKNAKVVILGVQHVAYSSHENYLLKFLKPDLLLTLSKASKDIFLKRGIKVKVLPPAVDCTKFKPATRDEREAIRREYNIPAEKKVIMHAGCIKAKRNLECFFDIQKINNVQVVIIGSTSTGKEDDLKKRLVDSGIHVIDDYVPDISKIYKMSDVYVFPVMINNGAIDMPLSVLEALACNIPVISTKFGGLVDYFEEGPGLTYMKNTDELPELIIKTDNGKSYDRNKIERFTWNKFAEEVIIECEEIL